MLGQYVLLTIFLIFVVLFSALLITISYILGPRRKDIKKEIPYESGIIPTSTANRRLSVRFYLTAMIFIIFDVEGIFFFPWAVILRHLGWFGIIDMGIFMLVLVAALAHLWAKGGLDWD
jgi:NADH-quinone oxidoreductase subunit A